MKNIIYFALPVLAALCMTSCRSEKDNEVLALRLDKTSIELVKGESVRLNATVVPAVEGAAITWFSEDESYVTVDQEGLVTAVAIKKDVESSDSDEENPQAVSVFARYEGGAAECEVTVLPLEPAAISIIPEQTTMNIGGQMMFSVNFDPSDADVRDVEWSSSNAFVAVVKDGVVTAKGYGSCEIIAKCGKVEARAYILVL